MLLDRLRRRRSSTNPLRFEFPDGELETDVFLGDVTDRSVRAWARLPSGPTEAQLEVDGRVVASAPLEPYPEHDHVAAAVLELDAPRPGTSFRVVAGGVTRGGVLAPLEGAPARFAFGFGSCHQPFDDPPLSARLTRNKSAGMYRPLLERLSALDARFVLLLGDQVYSDAVSRASVRELLSNDDSLTDAQLVDTYRHLYRGYFNHDGFRALMEAVPAYLTWDDHDIFDGAGSLIRPAPFDERLRRAAGVAFREYQHLRNPGARLVDDPPFSFSFWYANAGFHVLDLRGCREFADGRILGEQGWTRLEGFLDEASSRGVPTIFIGASVPVVHGSPHLMSALEFLPTGTGRDIRDRWVVPRFRHERERLLDLLFRWQSSEDRRQVVILSGDVHVGAAFSLTPRRGPGHIRQWTSSAFSTPTGVEHVVANRVVSGLAGFGEDTLRVRRRGLVTTNNAGLVQVEPLEDGGHALTFRSLAYDARSGTLRGAFIDRAFA